MIKLPIFGKNNFYKINPSKIIALGFNYRDHIEESTKISINYGNKKKNHTQNDPKEPILFSKTPNVLNSPNNPIIIPKIAYFYGYEEVRTDIEAELAIIIKKKGRYIEKANWQEYIFGYTCFNDVSQRNIQKSDTSGWFRGKSFDTFGPIGPQILLSEDLPDPQNLRIQSRINGKNCQDSNTKYMIFDIPTILEYISANFTLEEGDIISTGTPAGVSPIYDGDYVEVEIEKIGILKNSVLNEHYK